MAARNTSKNTVAAAKPRVRKLKRKDKKKFTRSTKKIPSSFSLLKKSCMHVWQHKKLFVGILLVFAIFYTILVKGFATQFKLSETSSLIDEALGDGIGTPEKALALVGSLFGTSAETSGEAASVYQLFLFIIVSLVIIWALRQTFEGTSKISVKDAYYKSMGPFITYCIVGIVIIIQCIPALLGLSLYSLVVSGGVAVGALENILWLIVLLAGLFASVYFLSSSLFASYIITLPNMTPLAALRSARKLVKYRRSSVLIRVVFLPIFVTVCFLVIFLPLVILLPLVAEILFAALSFVLIVLGHTYLYFLYRELL